MSIMTRYAGTSLSSYNPIPGGCVAYLPLWHPNLSGTTFKSIDPFGHTCTRDGGVMSGDGFTTDGDDKIEIPASATVLDFVAGDFSIIGSMNVTTLGAPSVLYRGEGSVNGYRFYIHATGKIYFATYQDGAVQYTYSSVGDIVTGTWCTVGLSRVEGVAKVYRNGVDVTLSAGAHTHPVTSPEKAKIFDGFTGIGKNVLVYDRSLSTAEHLAIHNVLKQRY